jgi:hypothetical protein
MPLRFGLLIYPLVIILMAWMRHSSPVSQFIKAKATSPETARKPSSVGVKHMELLERPIKKGVLVSTGDGRLYVNMQRMRRNKRIMTTALTLAGVAIAAFEILMWHPWSA